MFQRQNIVAYTDKILSQPQRGPYLLRVERRQLEQNKPVYLFLSAPYGLAVSTISSGAVDGSKMLPVRCNFTLW